MRLKKIVYIFLTLMCMLVVSGCGKSKVDVDAPIKTNIGGTTDSVDADVFIDGTCSMAGYVNYEGTTNFVDAVKNIERTIVSTWKNDSIQYVKFGDTNQVISRDEFLKIDNIEFYNQFNTRLDNVIETTDENKLSIIVTDLFQTNQDTDSLMLAIKRKVFSNTNNAFAIIGLKSQFDGKIYDIGKNLLKFDYSSSDEKASYRPFYLLVLGSEKDTRNFVQAYKNKYSDCKVVMYSKNIGIDTILLEDTRVPAKRDKNDKGKPMARVANILSEGEDLQYRLNTDVKESKVNLIANADGLIMNPKIDQEGYFVRVNRIEKWESVGKSKDSGLLDKVTGNNNKNVAFKFTDVKDNGFANINIKNISCDGNQKMSVELTMRLDPLGINKQEGIHRLQFSILPKKKNYVESVNVFDEWDISDDEWEGVQFSELGSKTLNISKFNRLLSEMNYELNGPGLHELYVYFDVK